MNKIIFILLLMVMFSCSQEDTMIDDEKINQSDKNEQEKPQEVVKWDLSTSIDLSNQDQTNLSSLHAFSDRLINEAGSLSGNENFSISPISIITYLSMISNATTGEFRNQVLKALNIEDLQTLNDLIEKLMHFLPCEENGSALAINNRIWLADGINVPESFSSTLQKHYNAGVENVDFHKESTFHNINQWIFDTTNGLIRTILKGDWQQYRDILMTSANTVYFKGNWKQPFDPALTDIEKFNGLTKETNVKMMHKDITARYSSSDIAELVVLEFEKPTNTIEFYLPRNKDGNINMVDLITSDIQKDLRNGLRNCDISLSLPSFKTESKIKLNKILSNAGISDTESVDMSLIGIGNQPIEPQHQTSFKIDEKGAEMAAYTGMLVTAKPENDKLNHVSIKFDRSFMYIIRNYHTGLILMAGVVGNLNEQ